MRSLTLWCCSGCKTGKKKRNGAGVVFSVYLVKNSTYCTLEHTICSKAVAVPPPSCPQLLIEKHPNVWQLRATDGYFVSIIWSGLLCCTSKPVRLSRIETWVFLFLPRIYRYNNTTSCKLRQLHESVVVYVQKKKLCYTKCFCQKTKGELLEFLS